MQLLSDFEQHLSHPHTDTYKPVLFKINSEDEQKRFRQIIKNNAGIAIHDRITAQIRELVKIQNPTKKLSEEDYQTDIIQYLKNKHSDFTGNWCYYPWNKNLVHILNEDDFINIRTNRSKYKITDEEHRLLRTKKIGVIGLSVGQSVSVTAIIERTCSEIRLADFDDLELSNLNRIRTGIHNLGLKKVFVVAREIAEIDPYIKVVCFENGLTEENMDEFFTKGGKLDLLIEEADGFDIKILCRHKAKALQVPVIMEASDRCMVDVERFDLEPERPILHGLVEHLDIATLKKLKTTEEKIPYMLDVLGIDTCSTRLKASMLEIEQTITTWPQLASAVAMGGGITADISRRILLNQYKQSGRYHIDIEELVGEEQKPAVEYKIKRYDYPELTEQKMLSEADKISHKKADAVDNSLLQKWAEAALLAPSAGNNQPWKWLIKDNTIYQFYDKARAYSWTDYRDITSMIALGCSYENLFLAAANDGYELQTSFFPSDNKESLLVSVSTAKKTAKINEEFKQYVNGIGIRCTNRKQGNKSVIPAHTLKEISKAASDIEGASLEFFTEEAQIAQIASLVAGVEKMRFLVPQGHYEFFKKELRWDDKHAQETKDGLDIATLELSAKDTVGLKVISEEKVLAKLIEWKGGGGLENISKKGILSASAIGLIHYKANDKDDLFQAGRALERAWIKANLAGLSFHPISSPVFILPRIVNNDVDEIPETLMPMFRNYLHIYNQLLPEQNNNYNMFLFRVHIAEAASKASFRKSSDELITIK